MTRYNYVITNAAENDLLNIWSYIADDNPKAADKLIDKLIHCMESLADMPLMGRSRDDIRLGYRSFPVGHYVVFYRVSKNTIEIMHVLHGKRDITSFQFGR